MEKRKMVPRCDLSNGVDLNVLFRHTRTASQCYRFFSALNYGDDIPTIECNGECEANE